MKCYLAGPMSGYPDHNIPAFREAASTLRARGYEIISPADACDDQSGRTWEEWMRLDIKLLMECDGVFVLPGWERSRGARLEVHIGRSVGLEIVSYPDGSPVLDHAYIDPLLEEVVEWANATFPNSVPSSKVAHLHKEVCELLQTPTDGEEMADVVILVAHLAAGCGVNLRDEIAKKLAKNRLRKWGEPDKDGVIEHVREAS